MARSGFIHPLSVLPTLIALTACPDPHFASKAYATLSLIYQKYASLCATRFAEPARQSHMYMLAVAGSHAIAQGEFLFARRNFHCTDLSISQVIVGILQYHTLTGGTRKSESLPVHHQRLTSKGCFSLVRDKRQTRLDYLKVLSRMFEVEPGAECSEVSSIVAKTEGGLN